MNELQSSEKNVYMLPKILSFLDVVTRNSGMLVHSSVYRMYHQAESVMCGGGHWCCVKEIRSFHHKVTIKTKIHITAIHSIDVV